MKFVIRNTFFQEFNRLLPADLAFDPSLVRIQRTKSHDLIFFEDYENLSTDNLTQVILNYNLDPDRLGVVIDEVRIINNPHILKNTKKIINPSRIFIKPISTVRSTKMIKEGIDYFINNNDWSLFDNYINESTENIENTANLIGKEILSGGKKGFESGLKDAKENIQTDLGKWGKRAVKFSAGLYVTNKILNQISKEYAENDAKKPKNKRSRLIATLRVLKGKLPEYESKLERTKREDYERRSLLGKIIFKIKSAILLILGKLGLLKASTEDM